MNDCTHLITELFTNNFLFKLTHNRIMELGISALGSDLNVEFSLNVHASTCVRVSLEMKSLLVAEIYGKCQAARNNIKWNDDCEQAVLGRCQKTSECHDRPFMWRIMSIIYENDTIKATMASRRKNQLWYIVVGLLAFCVAVDHQCSSEELAIWQYFMSLHSDIYWFPYVNDVIRCFFLRHFHHLCALRFLIFFFILRKIFSDYFKYNFFLFNILLIFTCFTFNFVPKIWKISL